MEVGNCLNRHHMPSTCNYVVGVQEVKNTKTPDLFAQSSIAIYSAIAGVFRARVRANLTYT